MKYNYSQRSTTQDAFYNDKNNHILTGYRVPSPSKSAPSIIQKNKPFVTEKGESNHVNYQQYEPSNTARQLPPLPDAHYLMNENSTLRYQLENLFCQIRLERQEYQRRLRHLTARIDYLEEIDRLSHSPDQFSNEIKPYYTSKKYVYNKKRVSNDDACATQYLSKSSDAAMRQKSPENNKNNNKRGAGPIHPIKNTADEPRQNPNNYRVFALPRN